jgi:hypothetical protein
MPRGLARHGWRMRRARLQRLYISKGSCKALHPGIQFSTAMSLTQSTGMDMSLLDFPCNSRGWYDRTFVCWPCRKTCQPWDPANEGCPTRTTIFLAGYSSLRWVYLDDRPLSGHGLFDLHSISMSVAESSQLRPEHQLDSLKLELLVSQHILDPTG